jgi:PiT family inorganic phosphate transporter
VVGGSLALAAVSIIFALITGANEGGAVITMGLHQRALRPIGAIAVLTAGVMVAPFIFGTDVAKTLARRLVVFENGGSRIAFGVGLCGALLIVGLLTTLALPTSLSLALVGGITGSGLGYGLPVSWHGLALVLVFGAMTPLVAAIVTAGLTHGLRAVPSSMRFTAVVKWATLGFYIAQVMAYGANGGQKVLAVFVVCGVAGGLQVPPSLATTAVIGGCFAVGTLVSFRRLAGRLGRDLIVVRPIHLLASAAGSSVAVFASMLGGMPASMTESIASALVGAGVSESRRRVRWKAVGRLGMAWLVTFPASLVVAMSAAALARSMA